MNLFPPPSSFLFLRRFIGRTDRSSQAAIRSSQSTLHLTNGLRSLLALSSPRFYQIGHQSPLMMMPLFLSRLDSNSHNFREVNGAKEPAQSLEISIYFVLHISLALSLPARPLSVNVK